MDEDDAIPRCRTWREANPEPCTDSTCSMIAYDENVGWLVHTHPAPYCCSAYCARCHRLRLSAGVPPIEPNEWMNSHG